jgi:RimJ/RimL family protein N-acetyltransferase
VKRPQASTPDLALALSDGRICLRPLAEPDAALYLRIYTDATLVRGLGGALSRSAAARSFAIACRTGGAGADGARHWWAIRDAGGDGAGIGLAGLQHDGRTGELGVIVDRRHQGAGVAGRALSLLATHALQSLALAQLRIRHAPDNVAMSAVAARLGWARADPQDRGGDWLWRWPPPR